MCGIAGYNVSEQWKGEYITPDVQKKILQEAWLHNLHRGSDAAGYFALKDDGNYKVYKQNDDAATLLEKNLRHSEIPVAKVFGAHTRAQTKGDAKVKANNHPVFYDGIWVTHNGTIRNDEEIKKTVPEAKQKRLAEVDSIAIPIRLSAVETPLDVETVVNAVSELQGGYAFHAVWREHPGVSVLARGVHSPLMLAQHKYGAVFYASEQEAIWAMIAAMGLDPTHEEWDYYSIHEDSVIVVLDGVPVAWADFDLKADEVISRVLPAQGDRKTEVVYTSKGKYDFPQKTGERGRDLSKADKIELLYTADKGALKVQDKYPRSADTDVFSAVSEADRVVLNVDSGNRHIFFGEIEIIMSGRVVLDIYDHSKFKTNERWFVDPQITDPLDTFDDFLKEKSTAILQTPDPKAEYRYARRSGPIPLGRGVVPQAGMLTGGKRQLESKTEGLKLIKSDPVLTWTNLRDVAVGHNTLEHEKQGFVFRGNDLRCTVHDDVLMQNHKNPAACGYAKASAAYMLSCAADLEVLTTLLPASKIVEKTSTQACKGGQHDIHGTVYFEIILASDRYFEILIEEECLDCGTTWELDDVPFWLLGVVGGKKDLMTGYGAHYGTR